MSGADKQRWQITPDQECFRAELLALRNTFSVTGSPIYEARNILKRMMWQGQPIIVKSFVKPNALRRQIYGRFRKSKAEKSFLNARELQARGVCTPCPIGFVEYYASGGLAESFYACHEWMPSMTLREALSRADPSQYSKILKAFGTFVWSLHQSGVNHRDLSPGNILISAQASSSQLDNECFCLVDINRMKFKNLTFPERMRNFAMLWASDDDLKIIISAYAGSSGDSLSDALAAALSYSHRHKKRAIRKENLKTLLRLH